MIGVKVSQIGLPGCVLVLSLDQSHTLANPNIQEAESKPNGTSPFLGYHHIQGAGVISWSKRSILAESGRRFQKLELELVQQKRGLESGEATLETPISTQLDPGALG